MEAVLGEMNEGPDSGENTWRRDCKSHIHHLLVSFQCNMPRDQEGFDLSIAPTRTDFNDRETQTMSVQLYPSMIGYKTL
jgi:hypothetical protein